MTETNPVAGATVELTEWNTPRPALGNKTVDQWLVETVPGRDAYGLEKLLAAVPIKMSRARITNRCAKVHGITLVPSKADSVTLRTCGGEAKKYAIPQRPNVRPLSLEK